MSNRDIAVKVESISKLYRIGLKDEMPNNFASLIFDFIRKPIKNYRKYRSLYRFEDIDVDRFRDVNNNSDIIWALKNVSFELERGEVLGIIGRNGAGKSTLLKILARITNPTSGNAEIRGRVTSLLEVGTGFHPELTGRENVYLNGTVLGMRKKEIEQKFDEIVAFSEVEKFLDTPVKRYSSGMRVRLAFSVAAHLEPEILIVDEVLAVGDSAFQKKCLNKMEGVAKEGRTVLFVSHNMGMVSDLCSKCIRLSNGEIVASGKTKEIVSEFVSSDSISGSIDLKNWSENRIGNGPMRVLHLSTADKNGQIKSRFTFGEPITFNIGVSGRPDAECIINVSIWDTLGHLILHFSNLDDKSEVILPAETADIQMHFEDNVLNQGTYYVTIVVADGFNILNDMVPNSLYFTIETVTVGRIISTSPVCLPAKWGVRAKNQYESDF
jgi:lipopolysaccharide transport system ATP-binding protein